MDFTFHFRGRGRGMWGWVGVSDNKQKLWFPMVKTQLRNHSNIDLEDHIRRVISQDLSEEVTQVQIDKMAPAMEVAERISSTKTLKQGRVGRIQRAGKAMNVEHHELERLVLRWGLRVSRRLDKHSGSQPLQDFFWCWSQHRISLWNKGPCCLRYTYYWHHHVSSFMHRHRSFRAHPLSLYPLWASPGPRPSASLLFSLCVLQTHGPAARPLIWHLFWPSWLV